ncbi:5998_t:CDS:2, partial [Paraglomus occultum]
SIIKLPLYIIWLFFVAFGLARESQYKTSGSDVGLPKLVQLLKTVYLLGMIPLCIFTGIIHPLYFEDRYPFVSLMFTSVYCAFGVIYSWAEFSVINYLDYKS